MNCPNCSGTGQVWEYGPMSCYLCHGSGKVQGSPEQEKEYADYVEKQRLEEIDRALDRTIRKKKKKK